MTLSNTATPRYYGEFRDAVLRGEIPVNKEISMEMNRIDALIADPFYYYDDKAVEGWVKFCEHELTTTDGGDLSLLPSFKLWGEQVFAWYYFIERDVPQKVGNDGSFGMVYVRKHVKKRLITKQYLIVARGAAKSMYAECIQAYFLIVDPETTHQITTAPTMKQAEEVMSPFRTAITRKRGPVFQFMGQGSLHNTTGNRADRLMLASTKKGIENFPTNSLLEIRPMSINKLQGLRPKVTTIDEWLSGDLREDIVGAVEQGASKLDDYLILAISSEGTVRNGAGDTMKLELHAILRGEYVAPHISIFHYRLDDISEVADPSKWQKANPNIGITVTYDTYQQDVERAEANPAAKNDILAKRFGIPMEGFTYFFTFEEVQPHRRQNFDGLMAAMGIDLSQGDDFCAFTFLFPLQRGFFGVKTRSYISEMTLHKLPGALRHKYEQLRKEETLHVMNGNILDLDEVYDDLELFIEQHNYQVNAVGYDPWGANEFIKRWTTENSEWGVVKVPQGARTESIPIGEIKKITEDRLLLFDEGLMSYTMGNAIIMEDTNGNRKLLKRRSEEKIDNVSALIDAWVALKANKDSFD
jgi:phage terminase large subunit-like protein